MGIVMLIMAVTALNRLNLSIAGKTIDEAFAFDTIKMGHIFSPSFGDMPSSRYPGDTFATASAPCAH